MIQDDKLVNTLRSHKDALETMTWGLKNSIVSVAWD